MKSQLDNSMKSLFSPNDSNNLMDYSEAVENLAKFKSSLLFSNTDNEHAAIVMENIFKYSESIVRIFANNFSGKISNKQNYCDGLNSFLSRSRTKLHVLFDSDPNPDSSIGYRIIRDFKDKNPNSCRIIIKKASDEFKKRVSEVLRIGEHFTLGDHRMFRLEFNSELHEAVACFNDPKLVSRLGQVFDNEIKKQ